MSTLVDQNEKPIPTNGHDQNRGVQDVRAIPTGTLFYNLIRYTNEELGLESMIKQIEMHKEQQKMVADPPQLTRAREVYEDMSARRFIIAREINERFAAVDHARMKECGISIVTPDTPPAVEDKTS